MGDGEFPARCQNLVHDEPHGFRLRPSAGAAELQHAAGRFRPDGLAVESLVRQRLRLAASQYLSNHLRTSPTARITTRRASGSPGASAVFGVHPRCIHLAYANTEPSSWRVLAGACGRTRPSACPIVGTAPGGLWTFGFRGSGQFSRGRNGSTQ